jgi:hypothetical protein
MKSVTPAAGIRAAFDGEGRRRMRASVRTSVAALWVLGSLVEPAAGQRAAAEEFLVVPRESVWSSAVPARLDPDQALPWPDIDHRDSLRGRVERFLGARWRDADGNESSTGDVLQGLVAARSDRDSIAAALARAERTWPAAFASWGDLLSDLLRDRGLYGDDWLPSRSTGDDGFHMGPAVELGKPPMPAWRKVKGSQTVQQAATLIVADLVALETAENDYRDYVRQIGTSYESIFPVEGSLLRSPEEDEQVFSALRVSFVCDLPFPFSSYRCELQILKRLGPGGVLQTDTWSGSRDFLWMAGSNVYLPVEASDGGFVGMIAVRTFGFDLRGVPDGDSDRAAGLRAVLGNLKRGAEPIFAAREDERPPILRGVIPDVPVRGRRP